MGSSKYLYGFLKCYSEFFVVNFASTNGNSCLFLWRECFWFVRQKAHWNCQEKQGLKFLGWVSELELELEFEISKLKFKIGINCVIEFIKR